MYLLFPCCLWYRAICTYVTECPQSNVTRCLYFPVTRLLRITGRTSSRVPLPLRTSLTRKTSPIRTFLRQCATSSCVTAPFATARRYFIFSRLISITSFFCQESVRHFINRLSPGQSFITFPLYSNLQQGQSFYINFFRPVPAGRKPGRRLLFKPACSYPPTVPPLLWQLQEMSLPGFSVCPFHLS